MRVSDIQSIQIQIASSEEILSWSYGEVTKPETINYRTQKSEKDGLFCQRIFGPEKDYECYCAKYKRIRYKGVICDKCGVEVIKAVVRRERMGHIKLAYPVAHIWFLRGVPSHMGMVLGIPMQQLESIIYFAAYIITEIDEKAKKMVLNRINQEYKVKLKTFNVSTNIKGKKNGKQSEKKKIEELKKVRNRTRNQVLNIKRLQVLSEVEFNILSSKYGEVFLAETGSGALRKLFSEINFKKEIQQIEEFLKNIPFSKQKKFLDKLKFFKKMDKAGIRPEWMFMTVFPVLPPDLRPMVQLDGGRYASSDLNDLYRRVINRNNRLKRLLEINAPEVIVRNEKRMLQEAVDALIDNGMRKGQTTKATTGGRRLLKSLSDMLKGKQGRFRQNLLGKRVDYSGRSVIVVGPDLKLFQCGLPKKMALELFKPFVIKKILDKELFYNVKGATRFIELEHDEIWAILEEIVKNKLVLLNRAPTLHRLGIQAFQPVLIEGDAIQLHPMVCKAFNADFDGDTMAIHLPLSEQAQKEAKNIMLSSLNLLNPATGTPIAIPTHDIVFGCYFLTMFKESLKKQEKIFGNSQEAILAYEFGEIDLRSCIKVRFPKSMFSKSKKNVSNIIETSVGRIIFNNILPFDFSFQNYEMSDKNLNNVLSEIIEKYSWEIAGKVLDKIKDLGFKYSTLSGVSWGMDDLIIPKNKKKIILSAQKQTIKIQEYYQKGRLSFKERRTNIIEIWIKAKSSIEELIPKTLFPFSPAVLFIESGARGSWTQLLQMTGMKGLVINPAGEIIELPIKSSLKEGFDVLEYFISTHGARKGTVDTALRTSTAGYLTRRLVDVAHDVIVVKEDCNDQEGVIISLKSTEDFGQKPIFKILGRTILEDIIIPGQKDNIKKNEIIDWAKAGKIIGSNIDKIRVRSPLSCKITKGVCQKCYGWDLGRNQLVKLGEAVGVVAAQAIGEPGTQLTMRTFHTGGVASASDITKGLPRVEEIFEARLSNSKAVISRTKGKVVNIIKEKDIVILVLMVEKETEKELRNQEKTKKDSQQEKVKEVVKYEIPIERVFEFKKGEKIEKGQQLCEGNLDLKELFKIVGVSSTQQYIIEEIQKIYVSQGVSIHNKHIEVIARQMFSRVKIQKTGDSSFSQGEVVEKSCFLEENIILKKAKKKIAHSEPIILGISKIALSTDSFLSAASFQETSRVLIKAALEGKEDKLKGLKENVIIGKLLPIGTEFKKIKAK